MLLRERRSHLVWGLSVIDGVRGAGGHHTVQWDRVEEGRGPMKICVYFTSPNKKLNVTDGCCLCLDHDPEGVGA